MSGMRAYYTSRAILSALFVVILLTSEMQGWAAVLQGLVALGYFIWAPRSGRYAVHPEFGVTALRRDERTQAINDKAARNAFVVTILVISGIVLYFGAAGSGTVPMAYLQRTLILGAAAYFVFDFLQRRS